MRFKALRARTNNRHNVMNNDATMNTNNAEQLSAVLDGDYLTDAELDNLLSDLADNPAVLQQAARNTAQWNIIGDAMRAGLPGSKAESVAPSNVIRPSAWQRWSKPITGIAVAAGVAAVAVMVGQQPINGAGENTIAAAPVQTIAPTGDNSMAALSAEQLRNVVAASNRWSSSGLSKMSPFELARMARVDASMNGLTPYEPISREELLELQKPLNSDAPAATAQ